MKKLILMINLKIYIGENNEKENNDNVLYYTYIGFRYSTFKKNDI